MPCYSPDSESRNRGDHVSLAWVSPAGVSGRSLARSSRNSGLRILVGRTRVGSASLWLGGLVLLAISFSSTPSAAQQAPAVHTWRVVPPGEVSGRGGQAPRRFHAVRPVEYAEDYDEATAFDDPEFDVSDIDTSSGYVPMDGWRQPPSLGCDDWGDTSLFGCGLIRIDQPTGYWLSGGYLLWSISGAAPPPLLRSGEGTSPGETGVMNFPGRTLLGGNEESMTLSGFEVGGGVWFDHCQQSGWEFRYSGLPSSRDSQTVDSVWTPRLGRPYVAGDGSEAALLVAHPDFAEGAMTMTRRSELHSVEALRRDAQVIVGRRRLDSLFGFRYLYLGEGLELDQTTRYFAVQPPIAAGSVIEISDQFKTRNHFTSFSMGLDLTEKFELFDFNLRGGLSLGMNSMDIDIRGETTATVPNSSGVPIPATFPGGLLAQSTNAGKRSQNRFALLPELQTGITAHLTPCWRWEVGYRLFYLSEAVQPGDQIDRSASQFPPETPVAPFTPEPVFRTGGILVQGLRTAMVFDF